MYFIFKRAGGARVHAKTSLVARLLEPDGGVQTPYNANFKEAAGGTH